MTYNKRAKNSRQRGSWTHGWGAKKKHRGAGHRGGRGNAGTGKKGDAKKPRYWKDPDYFGKHGFVSIQPKYVNTINIAHLDMILDTLVKKGKATLTNGTYTIDLTKQGFTKLLGAGTTSKKININVSEASEKAAQKIQKSGGKLNLPAQPQKKQEAEA